jgi:hypothetical protein
MKYYEVTDFDPASDHIGAGRGGHDPDQFRPAEGSRPQGAVLTCLSEGELT